MSYLKITLFSLGLLFLYSCEKKSIFNEIDSTFTLDDFESVEELEGQTIDLGLLLNPVFLFHHDSLLFVCNSGTSNIIHLYNLHNGQKAGEIIGNGDGPNELRSVLNLDFMSNGDFYAFDIITQQIKTFHLTANDSITVESTASFHPEVPPISEPVILHNNHVAAMTVQLSPLGRFYEFDSSGKFLGEKGNYPSYDREIPLTATADLYRAHSAIRTGKRDRFLLAYRYADLIEIYDDQLNSIKRIQGPHVFLPDFNLKSRGDGNMYFQPSMKKTKLAFSSVDSNEDYILLLYQGGTFKEEGIEGIHYSYMVLMDWEGNPVKYYKLNRSISTFCVDWSGKIIYGLDQKNEPEVVKFLF